MTKAERLHQPAPGERDWWREQYYAECQALGVTRDSEWEAKYFRRYIPAYAARLTQEGGKP
jgi:hypothetical protein